MAYAAYRYPPGNRPAATAAAAGAGTYKVLTVVIPIADCYRFRNRISQLRNVGIVRCVPRANARASLETSASHAVMHVRLPSDGYASVLHCVIGHVRHGTVGRLEDWGDYLGRIGAGDAE